MVERHALRFVLGQRGRVGVFLLAYFLPQLHRDVATLALKLRQFVQLAAVGQKLLIATAMTGHHHRADFTHHRFGQQLALDRNNFVGKISLQPLDAGALDHRLVALDPADQCLLSRQREHPFRRQSQLPAGVVHHALHASINLGLGL